MIIEYRIVAVQEAGTVDELRGILKDVSGEARIEGACGGPIQIRKLEDRSTKEITFELSEE